MCMKAKGQYISSVILGVTSSVLLWYFLVTSVQLFTKFSYWILVPPILSGVVGGAFVFYFAPEHKSKLTLIVGFLVAVPMLFFLFKNGFSHLGRNPIIWYWPVYIIPSFFIGGQIVNRLQRGT